MSSIVVNVFARKPHFRSIRVCLVLWLEGEMLWHWSKVPEQITDVKQTGQHQTRRWSTLTETHSREYHSDLQLAEFDPILHILRPKPGLQITSPRVQWDPFVNLHGYSFQKAHRHL